LWDGALIVVPTLSRSQASNVASIEQLFRSAGAQVAIIANGRSALEDLRARGLSPLTQHRNLGFAAAVNAARASRTRPLEWLLIVNDDVGIDSLAPFDILAERRGESAIITFGPEPSRPIPKIGGTFAALAMIPLGRARSRDPVGIPFILPKGSYTPFSLVAIEGALWDRLGGLDERFPFMYEDADFSRRAESEGATRIALHTPEQIRHERGVTGRSNVQTILPTVTSSAFQYLQKWGLGTLLARTTCVAALLLRTLMLPASRVPIAEHARALLTALKVAAGVRKPALPGFEES
jgi:GT2 family glycosyltransferase